ncbi:MAG: rhomboid family intramembrane serine protease [Bdellovibrionaceae bacterium]|nr:rhomboid family intramembrane serine protease [Pseudobdellovibrionaceae bacterium]MDW8189827.1 rhomboid family intramembrane serine protease [Pseudobdellovibrionaceae bacterium]
MTVHIPPLTRTMKVLLSTLLGSWIVLTILGQKVFGLPIFTWLGLVPSQIFQSFWLWQPVTYMFLHSWDVSHLILNLLMTWFVGSELERVWGSRRFLKYYFFTGIGAGLLYTALTGIIYWTLERGEELFYVPVVGSSGAVFGLFLAFGKIFGERVIYFMFLFPMKAKHFVMILALIEFLSLMGSSVAGGEVANLAHLGGLLSGLLYFLLIEGNKYRGNGLPPFRKKSYPFKIISNQSFENEDKPPTRYWN